MKIGLLCLLIFINIGMSHAQEKWVMYARNYNNPFLHQSIKNFADKTKDEYGEYTISSSEDMEQGRAFAQLLKGEIDIFVGAPTLEREKLANAIYVPLDRGLLGFRLCLIHKENRAMQNLTTPNQFIDNNLTVGIGTHWPDRAIYEKNGFTTVTSPVHETLYPMLQNRRFDCLSRSVNEIDAELVTYKHLDIEIEKHIVFIYPNTDFIFINANNTVLLERLSKGIALSLEDSSFMNTFNEFYANEIKDHRIYERKLIFLKNSTISSRAMLAINQYGVASFLTNSLNKEFEPHE